MDRADFFVDSDLIRSTLWLVHRKSKEALGWSITYHYAVVASDPGRHGHLWTQHPVVRSGAMVDQAMNIFRSVYDQPNRPLS